MNPRRLSGLCLAILLSSPAHAYIGPGLGAGTLAVVSGVILSLCLALFALLWYPLKRLLRRRGRVGNAESEDDEQTQTGTPEEEHVQ